MSEIETSDSTLSLSNPSLSGFSEDGENAPEKPQVSHGKKSNRIAMFLFIALVLCVLIILILVIVLIISVYNPKSIEPNPSIEHHETKNEGNHEEGYEYPFFRADSGDFKMEGSVRTPVPIKGTLNIFNSEGQVMLIAGEGSEGLKLFKVEVSMYCCPEDIAHQPDNDFTTCSKVETSTIMWPGNDAEVARETIEATDTIEDAFFKQVNDQCAEGMLAVFKVESIEESDREVPFVCHGVCGPSMFSAFLSNHQQKFNMIEVHTLREIHEKSRDMCYQYSTSVKVADANNDINVAKRKFQDIIYPFCESVEVDLDDERIPERFQVVNNFCVGFQASCRYFGDSAW